MKFSREIERARGRRAMASSVVSGLILAAVVGVSPASANTVDDFESLDIGQAPSAWTIINDRVELGVTTLGGCTSVDTADYQSLREYYDDAKPVPPPGMGTLGAAHPQLQDRSAFIAPGASTQYMLGPHPLWVDGSDVFYAGPPTATASGADPTIELVEWEDLYVSGAPSVDQQTFLDLQKDWLNDRFGDLSQDSTPEFSVGVVDGENLLDDSDDPITDVAPRPGKVLQFASDMSLDDEGYVMHGPAVVTQDLIVDSTATFSFWFAASGASDDYHVFGYLLNTDTCTQFEVIDRTGEFADWELITVPVAQPGTYRFVFVSGTYDQSWGSAAGGLLWIDGMTCEGDCVVTSGDSGGSFDVPTPWYFQEPTALGLPDTL
jgi:hypothetical protein